MKNYITDIPYIDVDYCMYGLPYKKRTRIWNNFEFKGKLCNKECGSFFEGRHKQNTSLDLHLKERYRIPEELIKEWTNYFSH